MVIIYYKALAALLIFLTTLASVIHPLKHKEALNHTESTSLGEALASGIFLGAAFFHMLPDAIKEFGAIYPEVNFPIPEAICVMGFLLLLLLERLSLTPIGMRSKHAIPYIFAITLIIHSVTEGAALGISAAFTDMFMLLVAILAHKGSESFALCVTLLRYQLPYKHLLIIILFFSLMTPLGILLGAGINAFAVANTGMLAQAAFSAFVAGTFLYMSTLHHHHFHRHGKDSQGMLEFACLAAGLITMGVIAI